MLKGMNKSFGFDITKLDVPAGTDDILRHPGSQKPVRERFAPRPKVKPDGNPLNNPPYRDVNGKYRTKSLFLETINTDLDLAYQPRFTLLEWDFELAPSSQYYNAYPDHKIPSIRHAYLRIADPIEFLFAMEVLQSDRHWAILTESQFFQPYLEEWRNALDRKLKSEAVQNLRKISESMDEAKALQAAKWIGEGGYKARREKGRPTASQEAQELRIVTTSKQYLLEDAERLGLTIDTPPEGRG